MIRCFIYYIQEYNNVTELKISIYPSHSMQIVIKKKNNYLRISNLISLKERENVLHVFLMKCIIAKLLYDCQLLVF